MAAHLHAPALHHVERLEGSLLAGLVGGGQHCALDVEAINQAVDDHVVAALQHPAKQSTHSSLLMAKELVGASNPAPPTIRPRHHHHDDRPSRISNSGPHRSRA